MRRIKTILMQPIVWMARFVLAVDDLDQFVFENRMAEYERKKKVAEHQQKREEE